MDTLATGHIRLQAMWCSFHYSPQTWATLRALAAVAAGEGDAGLGIGAWLTRIPGYRGWLPGGSASKGKELGTFEHGFWAEVDESSMLLLSVRCAAVAAE